MSSMPHSDVPTLVDRLIKQVRSLSKLLSNGEISGQTLDNCRKEMNKLREAIVKAMEANRPGNWHITNKAPGIR